MKSRLMIEASAGTGKTQALGERLIELLRHGVKPQEIVALTFSRAAAGEIFERFVSLLADRVATDATAGTQLREVLATQHLSQIGTLDSFLARLVRVFPRELGLFGPPEIMDDYAAASERARISFAILRKTDAQLKKTFVDAFSLAMNRENVRSFVDAYRAFISSWHHHVTELPDEAAWGDPVRIWGRDPAFAHVTERELAAAADRLDATFAGQANWHAFADWVRNFRGRFGTLTGYTKKLLGGELNVFDGDIVSFTFSRRTIDLTREETLVVRDAVSCVAGYVIRMNLELARGVYRLISAFESEYAKKVRSAGRLVFSDVPLILARLPEALRRSLEYRLDAHIRAWALDEFQDTSREQWKVLSDLIDEAKQSDDEKSLFIVGDRKQAIYGWRNSDVGIFLRERESGAYDLDVRNETYRSGPVMVEAVNRVFARGRIKDEFPGWECPEHQSARPQLDGFVRTMEAGGRTMEDFIEPVFTALKATLGEALDDPRRQGVSAAVLVRDNRFGSLLADELKSRGLEGVVWEGESAILDTPALSGFLDLFHLADHPGDLLTYRHFLMTPLAAALYPNGVPAAAEISCAIARSFTSRGLVRTLRELRSRLPEDPETAWSRFTEERFTDMLRAAAEFELGVTAGTRLADFPGYLASKRKRTVAEAGRIKIMTIHRSKGLGFDYVVLPLYEHNALATSGDGPLFGNGWMLPDPGERIARCVGGLDRAYALRRDREEQGALCTYYVAMTRAKRAMTIVLHPHGSTLRFSDLVRSAALDDLAHPETTLATTAAVRDAPPSALPPPSRAPRVSVRRRLPSLYFQSGVSAATLFTAASARETARLRGSAAHAAMEKVEFSAELPRPDGFIELWREQSFEVFADGEWISGRFDRVTFFRTAAGLSAEIIDFKTSLADPEHYQPQLDAYRKAVNQLTGIPFERISARLQKIS